MESEIGKRLSTIINYYKLSQSEFGAKFNSNKQEISNWIRGTKMNVGRISDLLSNYPEINPGWFMLGRGEMLRKEYEKAEKEKGYHICYDESCNLEKEKLAKEIVSLKDELLILSKRVITLLEER